MKLPVAILAGGLATRLHPLTETIPKALVEVAGKPFILRQLDYLRRQGVSRAVLCVGFLGEQIEAVVGDGSSSGLTVSYSQDWPKLMGTGGALRQALPLLDSQFLVLYGDSYLPIDFSSVEQTFLSSGKPALMTVQRNADQWDKSNVLFLDNVIVEYNKRAPSPAMSHIDYGLGAISAQVLKLRACQILSFVSLRPLQFLPFHCSHRSQAALLHSCVICPGSPCITRSARNGPALAWASC